MPGTKGRSGGRNRKSVQTHILRGTFQPNRHQQSVIGALAASTAPCVPPADLLAGLGPEGRGFLESMYSDFEPLGGEKDILRLAAEQRDDWAQARAAGDAKTMRAACRLFLLALQRLGLPAAERK